MYLSPLQGIDLSSQGTGDPDTEQSSERSSHGTVGNLLTLRLSLRIPRCR